MDVYFLLLTFNVTVLARHEWIVWAYQQSQQLEIIYFGVLSLNNLLLWSWIYIYSLKCLFNSAQNHSNTRQSVITTSRKFLRTLKRSIYLTCSQFSTPFWLPHQPFSQRQNWTVRNVKAVKWTCPIHNLQSTSLKEAFSYELFCEEKKEVKLFPKNEELMYSVHTSAWLGLF